MFEVLNILQQPFKIICSLMSRMIKVIRSETSISKTYMIIDINSDTRVKFHREKNDPKSGP